jgi:Regulator of chromosome condensation (RCC1) repeat
LLQVHFDMLLRNSSRAGGTQDFIELLSAGPEQAQHHGLPDAAFAPSVNPDSAAPGTLLQRLVGDAGKPPAYLNGARPLHEQHVVSVAAGREFTLVATRAGEVWTFGCGKDHQLATGNFVQTDARPVAGRVARMLAENGGAVDVAAGETFCLALARNGSVIMWGKLTPEGIVCNAARGLPGMVAIAAGRRHAVFSDGESIWHVTTGSGAASPGFDKPTRLTWQARRSWSSLQCSRSCGAGAPCACSLRLSWQRGRAAAEVQQGTPLCQAASACHLSAWPQQRAHAHPYVFCSAALLAQQGDISKSAVHCTRIVSCFTCARLQGTLNGVAKLAAGGDASAVIDLDGTLWMWGRVADATAGSALPPAKTAAGGAPLPCFNAFERNPVRIGNLDKVQHVALGSNHVVAAVAR